MYVYETCTYQPKRNGVGTCWMTLLHICMGKILSHLKCENILSPDHFKEKNCITQFVYQNVPRSLKRPENITWKVSILC